MAAFPGHLRRDGFAASALFVAALLIGTSSAQALRLSSGRPDMTGFAQRVYGAAMMAACGHGLTTPPQAILDGDPDAGFSPVGDFLAMRRASVSCADVAGVPAEGLDGLQRASRYLLGMVAVTWWLTGPSWAGLDALIGVLFGLSIALAYLTARSFMGWGAAGAAALLWLMSPLHLQHLADVRDYSKTPFFLAAMAAIAFLLTRHRSAAVVVAVASATGAILGVGFGMRTDVLVNVVLVGGAALVFLPGRLADTWKVRLAAAAGCVLCFSVVAAPVFASFETRSSPWHVALLGYADDWDTSLGLVEPPYETGHFYSDSYVATLINAYWGRTTGGDAHVSVGLPYYAEASRAYYLAILGTFPADVAVRGLASVIKVLQLPFSGLVAVDASTVPRWLAGPMVALQRALMRLEEVSVPLFAAVVLGLSAQGGRLAALVLGLVVALGAYPSIQFQPRHVFHLEIIALWVVTLAVAWTLGTIHRAARGGAVMPDARPWRPVAALAIILLGIALPLGGLRLYQQCSAEGLLASYLAAETHAIDAGERLLPNGVIRLASGADVFQRPRGNRAIYSELLIADVSDDCGLPSVAMTFRYAPAASDVDFSRHYEVDVSAQGETTHVVFPLFETGGASPDPHLLSFEGVEVLSAERACLTQIRRVTSPDGFTLLLPAVLPADWRDRPLYERLLGWEHADASGSRLSHWSPPELALERAQVLRSAKDAPAFAAPIDYQAPMATVASNGSIRVHGLAASAGAYTIGWRPAALAKSSVVVVEGRLVHGGLTVGLTDDSGWASRVDIDTPGAFRAAVQPSADGAYRLVIANHRRDGSLKSRFDIARIVVLTGGGA